MPDFNKAMRIICDSKEFWFDGSVLTIRGYYSGESLKLDLSKLDEEMLEQLQPEEVEDEDE